MSCENCRLLGEALGEILFLDGVTNAESGITGPELLTIAYDYIRFKKKSKDDIELPQGKD